MRQALDLAVQAAREAGEVLLERYGEHLAYEEKSRRADLVTEVDRRSERLIVERIKAASPGATIVAEESGVHAGHTEERWFIDPLDGTTNYAHTYPMFCVSIACEQRGELVAAVVFAPKLGELFTAERGSGAFVDGKRISVSPVRHVADALVGTGFVSTGLERNLPHFRALSDVSHGVRRDGSAAIALSFVAAGRLDAFWEFGLSPWDVAAGALLVREAGGVLSAPDGSPFDYAAGDVLATNGALHAEMQRHLSG